MSEMKFFGPNGEEEMEKIDISTLSEIGIKKYLMKGREVILLAKKYTVGDITVPLANLTIEKKSNLREIDGKLIVELMFDFHEYQAFQPFGEIINRNGMKLIKTEVSVEKDDIMMAAARTSLQ